MSKLTTFLSSVDKLLTGHPVCFTNSLLVVLTAGGEKLFQSIAFKCPDDPVLAAWYGWLFLFGPFLILLACGMVLNEGLWHVYHGCNKRSEGAEVSLRNGCHSLGVTFFRALIVPCAWLFVSLLDGSYIVCSMADEPNKETEESLSIKAISQMASWVFLVSVVIVGTTVTCCMRCLDKKTFLELRYAQVYKKVETEELEKEMKERAQAVAKEHLKTLFSSNLPPKETWDGVTAKEDSNYSSLHKWCDQKKGGRGDNLSAGRATVAV